MAHSKNHTFSLDDLTNTKLEWSSIFLKELGLTSPTQRAILSRALDFYVEYLEDLVVTRIISPKSKEIKDEIYEIAKLSKDRPSVWGTHGLPKLDLESFGVFPKYRELVRACTRPIHKPFSGKRSKAKMDKVKSENPEGITFHQLKYKTNPSTPEE